jgi:hypothetical protein
MRICPELRNRKSRFRPAPELEDAVALCIDSKTDDRKPAREGVVKVLAIPALYLKYTFLIRWGVPPMSNLVGYKDFLLYRGQSERFAAQSGTSPIALQPPFRVEPVGRNLSV